MKEVCRSMALVAVTLFLQLLFLISTTELIASDSTVDDEPPAEPMQYKQIRLPKTEMEGESQVVEFPGPIKYAISGGAGRFVIAYLPLSNNVAILDLVKAKIVKTIDAPCTNPPIAAGGNHLLICDNEQKTLSRYNLSSFKLEEKKPLHVDAEIASMGMGVASFGPVLTIVNSNVPKLEFVDLETLEPMDVTWPIGTRVSGSGQKVIKTSANGKVFSVLGNEVYRLDGSFVSRIRKRAHFLPSFNGKFFTCNDAILNERLGLANNKSIKLGSTIPAVSAPFFLSYVIPKIRKQNAPISKTVNIHDFENFDSIGTIDLAGPFLEEISEHSSRRLKFRHERVFFIPQIELLVTLAHDSGSAVLQRLNIDEMLRSTGRNFLYVASTAPTHALTGEHYEYQLVAKSDIENILYSLESAPEGMTISEGGNITWNIPASFGDERLAVIVKIDNTKQSILHSFEITIPENARISETKRIAKKKEFEKAKRIAFEKRRKSSIKNSKTFYEEKRWNKSQERRHSFRVWVDTTGKHTVRAKFVRVVDKKIVVLVTENGKEIKLPLSRLSDEDLFIAVRNDLQPQPDSKSSRSRPEGLNK